VKKSALVFACFFILFAMGLAYSQEVVADETATTNEITEEGVVAPTTDVAQPEPQWQYFEVVSTDLQNNGIVVKYIDYDTDTEKQMTIAVDEKTTYENVASLKELKPEDALGVDYIVDSTGKSIATNISLEKSSAKEEDAAVEAPPVEEEVDDAGVVGNVTMEGEEEAAVEAPAEEPMATEEMPE